MSKQVKIGLVAGGLMALGIAVEVITGNFLYGMAAQLAAIAVGVTVLAVKDLVK